MLDRSDDSIISPILRLWQLGLFTEWPSPPDHWVAMLIHSHGVTIVLRGGVIIIANNVVAIFVVQLIIHVVLVLLHEGTDVGHLFLFFIGPVHHLVHADLNEVVES